MDCLCGDFQTGSAVTDEFHFRLGSAIPENSKEYA
jgi:hypothetical protein